MIQRLVRMYNRNQRCRPCLTRSLTSIAGLCAGDLLAQTSTGDGIDTKRLVRVGAFAFLLQAPVCFHFYRLLDKVKPVCYYSLPPLLLSRCQG